MLRAADGRGILSPVKERPFGPTGRNVPIIGQGTWQMEGDDRTGAIKALRRGLELGLLHVDTAELYGSGEAERIVAEAIVDRRDDVFLVSKVLPENATRKGTIRACEASLARLNTDRLDCYLLHWAGSHPLEGTLRAFEELEQAGKIRSFGVSNFDEGELEEALAIVGPHRLACNQVLYHLKERTIEHAVVPWCEEHGVAVVGYTPFGRGRFPPPPGDRVLASIAARHGTSPRAVALAFLTRRPGFFAIPKASRSEHVEENARALGLVLTPADIAEIDRAYPVGKRRRGVATL
jgi:diketogulonate reductase-like aldo/keto reductase